MTGDDRSKSLLIVGAQRRGKSMLTEQLKQFYAETGREVIIVDSDNGYTGKSSGKVIVDEIQPAIPMNRKARRAARSRRNK